MDSTMNSPSTKVLAIAGAAALVLVDVVSAVALPHGLGAALALSTTAVAGFVAFAAQSGRLRDERRLVYRPVYVRHQSVRHRVPSDDV